MHWWRNSYKTYTCTRTDNNNSLNMLKYAQSPCYFNSSVFYKQICSQKNKKCHPLMADPHTKTLCCTVKYAQDLS